GYLAISAIPIAINQGFIGMKSNNHISNYYIINWCQKNMQEITNRATGTTFPEISKRNFRPIPLSIPPVEIMSMFTARVDPLYRKIRANLLESTALETIRNSLLTLLLSKSSHVSFDTPSSTS